jgi:hypothetical protein
MADLKKDIIALQTPSNIQKSGLASSPYVLRKVFTMDPTIQRTIRAGEKAVPLIAEELKKWKKLDDITLAAYAYIIENVRPLASPEMFGAMLKTLEQKGGFFVHFATHAIRSGLGMQIQPLKMSFTQAEIIETKNKLR